MNLKKLNYCFFLIILMIFLLSGCREVEIKVYKHPAAESYQIKSLEKLPSYNPDSENQIHKDINLDNCDLTKLSLSNRMNDLKYCSFNTKTIWANDLPEEYLPNKILEIGKNPGLQVNELHKKGIKGQGIGIAVIDGAMLVDHQEYKDRVKYYDELRWNKDEAEMHGTAISSILVGNSVGVAPAADLYYIATFLYNELGLDLNLLADALERVLSVNQQLTDNNKIRVVSISHGWNYEGKGAKRLRRVIKKSRKKIFL